MKPLAWIAAAFCLLLTSTAQAEILELKGEGFVNGTVTAEDENSVTFKDARGQVRTIPRASILMREEEKKVSAIRRFTENAAEVAKKVSAPLKKVQVPSSVPGPAAPAGRPSTGRQADVDAATAEADNSTELMRAAFSAQLEQQRKMRRMTQEEQAYKDAASGPKPRFTSLDDDKR